jgi:hypothetical protein
MDPTQNGHAAVEANRAAHPRRTPGREPVGYAQNRRVVAAVMAVVLAATAILAVVLAAN